MIANSFLSDITGVLLEGPAVYLNSVEQRSENAAWISQLCQSHVGLRNI